MTEETQGSVRAHRRETKLNLEIRKDFPDKVPFKFALRD